jgi:hypothetical protein
MHGHGLWVAAQIADEFRISHSPAGTIATACFAITPVPPGYSTEG